MKEISIKNRTCYYFDDVIKIEDLDFDNILLDKNSYEIILIYDISNNTLTGAKPLRIRSDKAERFIRVDDVNRYLVLFGLGKYYAVLKRIRCFISQQSGFTYIGSHNYTRIKIKS